MSSNTVVCRDQARTAPSLRCAHTPPYIHNIKDKLPNITKDRPW